MVFRLWLISFRTSINLTALSSDMAVSLSLLDGCPSAIRLPFCIHVRFIDPRLTRRGIHFEHSRSRRSPPSIPTPGCLRNSTNGRRNPARSLRRGAVCGAGSLRLGVNQPASLYGGLLSSGCPSRHFRKAGRLQCRMDYSIGTVRSLGPTKAISAYDPVLRTTRGKILERGLWMGLAGKCVAEVSSRALLGGRRVLAGLLVARRPRVGSMASSDD
jgi:hypothetical protein